MMNWSGPRLLPYEQEREYAEELRRANEGQASERALAKLPAADVNAAARRSDAIRQKQAALGTTGLPPLLDWRRWAFGITDGAFKARAVYDRILIKQISDWHGEVTYGGGSIIMPDSVKAREENEAPRGIIVSAGAIALDNLQAHGIDVGFIVSFINMAPWKRRVDTIEGSHEYVLVMRDGDVIASEDTQALESRGWLNIVEDVTRHPKTNEVWTECVYEVSPKFSGRKYVRKKPWIFDDA